MLPLNYFLFLQIILFLFITPGTPRIVIISYSINYGVQKCVWAALGDVTANIIQATLVIFVLGSFFSDNPNFLKTFKWIGIIYLLYLARLARTDHCGRDVGDPVHNHIVQNANFSINALTPAATTGRPAQAHPWEQGGCPCRLPISTR